MSKDSVPTCNHLKPNGQFCQSPALNDDHYCYFHRSSRERIKRQLRHVRQQRPLTIPPLEDLETIQLAVGDVLNALLSDRIDSKKAGLLLYGLQTAAHAVQKCNFELHQYDEQTTRYSEYEQASLEKEIEQEIREEERQLERAQKKAAKTAAASTTTPQSTVPNSPEMTATTENNPENQPETADPTTVLPEKKPAERVTNDQFWSVVGDVARQNAQATARELKRQLEAAEHADEERTGKTS
jgi:hypothetical protein